MNNNLNINLKLGGEASFFVQYVLQDTGMSPDELFSKMISLYKEVYFNNNELAWIQGDLIISKLDSSKLKNKENG